MREAQATEDASRYRRRQPSSNRSVRRARAKPSTIWNRGAPAEFSARIARSLLVRKRIPTAQRLAASAFPPRSPARCGTVDAGRWRLGFVSMSWLPRRFIALAPPLPFIRTNAANSPATGTRIGRPSAVPARTGLPKTSRGSSRRYDSPALRNSPASTSTSGRLSQLSTARWARRGSYLLGRRTARTPFGRASPLARTRFRSWVTCSNLLILRPASTMTLSRTSQSSFRGAE